MRDSTCVRRPRDQEAACPAKRSHRGPSQAERDRTRQLVHATILFWKPQVALFVNEATLLPVLVPYAPSVTVIDRFPATLAMVLQAHGVDARFIDRELAAMGGHRLAKTENRSVVGIMNEFCYLAGVYSESDGFDLMKLSLGLSETPCGPLYARNGSPDRELAALVAAQAHF